MLAFPSLCLTSLSQSPLCLDLTTVSPAPPFSLKSSKSPRSARSTANAIVVEGRWLCGHNSPRSGQCGLWCRRFGGFSAADALAALEDGVAHKHGDHAIALRGVILTHLVPQVRSLNAFTNRRLLCLCIASLRMSSFRAYRGRTIGDHLEHMSALSNWPRNRLLLALPSPDLEQFMPELEQIRCERGQVLMDADSPLDHVFFPDSGVVSVVAVYADGSIIEMATTGREGCTSVQAILGAESSSVRLLVQIPGGAAAAPDFWTAG